MCYFFYIIIIIIISELRSVTTATCIGPLTCKQKNIYLNKAPPDVSSHLACVDMNSIMTFWNLIKNQSMQNVFW